MYKLKHGLTMGASQAMFNNHQDLIDLCKGCRDEILLGFAGKCGLHLFVPEERGIHE